ncbi:MAG: prephenate dehydrogenase/arogenate dehydrogenase family protein [Rickettsiales bacterium]|nr:prephenate dehydrogenase/arogenate dehydrogenase family protein [Rickettsiales bacterium]
MADKTFNKILIIGFGLIGGSFAKALRAQNLDWQIDAYDINQLALKQALESKIIDHIITLESKKISEFDFIIIAAPLSTYQKIFSVIKNNINPKTIIIDLGSLKNFISEILPKNLSANFVACHPIAGSEKNGFENSFAELFRDKKFIICKSQNNSEIQLKKVENLAKIIGCNVEFIDSKAHDEVYALVSHLPQFLSFLTAEFSPKKIADEFFEKVFRLDNSDPEIWSDIFALNCENLEKFYLEFFDNLEKNIELCVARPRHEDGVTKSESKIKSQQHEDGVTKSESKIKSQQHEDGVTKSESKIKSQQHEDGVTSEHSSLQNNLLTTLADLSPRRMTGSIDQKFFEENFATIFFRALIVVSYLQIPQIKTFQKHAGSGFADFTSIVAIFNYEPEKLANLIKKNQQKILKLFDAIS